MDLRRVRAGLGAAIFSCAVSVAQTSSDSLTYGVLIGDRATPPALYLATTVSGESVYGFFKSRDLGLTWNPLYLSEAGTPQPPVYTMAIHPNNMSLWIGADLAQGKARCRRKPQPAVLL